MGRKQMRIQKKRRKEFKTNYLKRLEMLKSGIPRVVFRKTNRYLISQYVESKEAQDKIIFGIDSRKILNYGWPKNLEGSLKGVTAAYFLGLLTGKKIIKDKLKTPIIDFGLYRVLPKTKLHSFVKGMIDAGVKIKDKKENFPEEDREKGKHITSLKFEEIKSKIEKS
ncbi:MAG: 50S ribosomal protein L18 [Nanoarchaeota archaeon]